MITPLSHDRFRVTDVQEQRVVIEFLDREIDETRPLQRAQLEFSAHTLVSAVVDNLGEISVQELHDALDNVE